MKTILFSLALLMITSTLAKAQESVTEESVTTTTEESIEVITETVTQEAQQ